MVPEVYSGGLMNVYDHFAHWQDISSRLNKDEFIIEVGCGCGLSSRIYSLKTEKPMYAVDKPNVVRMSAQMYPTPGVTYVGCDFNESWVYDNIKIHGMLDVVICVDVIEHIENKDLFLSELAKLPSDKGRFIICVPIGEDDNSWHVNHWQSTEEFMDDICRFLPRERVTKV